MKSIKGYHHDDLHKYIILRGMLEIKTPGSLPFPQRLSEKEHYREIYKNHNASYT